MPFTTASTISDPAGKGAFVRISIVPYTESKVEAVRQFNRRLRTAGSGWRFTESPVPGWLPRNGSLKLFQEYFVAVDENGAVHGGYALKQQLFSVKGREMMVGVCRMPISEAIINPCYCLIGGLLIRDALRRQPYLYALGMGGLNAPYARLLGRALKWKLMLVPFYFHALNINALLRQVTLLNSSPALHLARNILTWTRGAFPLIYAGQSLLKLPSLLDGRVASEPVECFGPWADRIWKSSRKEYSLTAVRDAAALNRLYPPGHPALRLRVRRQGEDVGWVVLLDTQMKNHPYFGDLRVGSLVDCFAVPGLERPVAGAGKRYLLARGVDVIISNQSHLAWRRALRGMGFLRGRSNYAFAVSKDLERLLEPLDGSLAAVHMTRGDGDGPINL